MARMNRKARDGNLANTVFDNSHQVNGCVADLLLDARPDERRAAINGMRHYMMRMEAAIKKWESQEA